MGNQCGGCCNNDDKNNDILLGKSNPSFNKSGQNRKTDYYSNSSTDVNFNSNNTSKFFIQKSKQAQIKTNFNNFHSNNSLNNDFRDFNEIDSIEPVHNSDFESIEPFSSNNLYNNLDTQGSIIKSRSQSNSNNFNNYNTNPTSNLNCNSSSTNNANEIQLNQNFVLRKRFSNTNSNSNTNKANNFKEFSLNNSLYESKRPDNSFLNPEVLRQEKDREILNSTKNSNSRSVIYNNIKNSKYEYIPQQTYYITNNNQPINLNVHNHNYNSNQSNSLNNNESNHYLQHQAPITSNLYNQQENCNSSNTYEFEGVNINLVNINYYNNNNFMSSHHKKPTLEIINEMKSEYSHDSTLHYNKRPQSKQDNEYYFSNSKNKFFNQSGVNNNPSNVLNTLNTNNSYINSNYNTLELINEEK